MKQENINVGMNDKMATKRVTRTAIDRYMYAEVVRAFSLELIAAYGKKLVLLEIRDILRDYAREDESKS